MSVPCSVKLLKSLTKHWIQIRHAEIINSKSVNESSRNWLQQPTEFDLRSQTNDTCWRFFVHKLGWVERIVSVFQLFFPSWRNVGWWSKKIRHAEHRFRSPPMNLPEIAYMTIVLVGSGGGNRLNLTFVTAKYVTSILKSSGFAGFTLWVANCLRTMLSDE